MSHYVRKLLTTADLDRMRLHLAIRAVKLSPDPSCDFCGDKHPVWVYAATMMSTGEKIDNWRWCACEKCGVKIETHNWTALEDNLVKWLQVRFNYAPEEVLRTVAKEALKDFHQYAKSSRDNNQTN